MGYFMRFLDSGLHNCFKVSLFVKVRYMKKGLLKKKSFSIYFRMPALLLLLFTPAMFPPTY